MLTDGVGGREESIIRRKKVTLKRAANTWVSKTVTAIKEK